MTNNFLLDLETDESYYLILSTSNATILANSIFGALRGLETFAQIIKWNGERITIPYTPFYIYDKPYWPWRGILIDCARHFMPISKLESILDSMVFSKLNVFHWHLSDAESFPLEISSLPQLAQKSSYSHSATYSSKDVSHIIKYAQYRGIRVVPEIDTPGHTYSIGKSFPEMIVNCKNVIEETSGFPNINSVALNLTNENLYQFLDTIYGELSTLFTDEFIHIGGDEVISRCFDEFPSIKNWMNKNRMNVKNYNDLILYFRTKITPNIVKKKKMIVWQEAIEEMIPYGNKSPLNPNNTVVQVWIADKFWSTIEQSLRLGYRTISSSGWYLDQQIPNPNKTIEGLPVSKYIHYLDIDTWEDFYLMNPFQNLNLSSLDQTLFLGGEIAQWGESVTPDSILANIWPRSAGSAERLWVGPNNIDPVNSAYHRLIRFQCYLLQRGIESSGLRPNYCTFSQYSTFVAGGLSVQIPVWSLIIIGTFCLVLVTFSVHLFLKKNTKKPSYESLN